MAKPSEYFPKSLAEYVKQIESLQSSSDKPQWFRGTGRFGYELAPSLYRHPEKKDPQELILLEQSLVTRFRHRVLPYLTRPLGDDWDVLFFMQHYGIPTRLLDWTENPLVALHFSLMSAPYTIVDSEIVYENSACVWVVDPWAWNKTALRHFSYDGGPVTPGEEASKGYALKSVLNPHPIAIYGAHNSARIVAQQGVFTIFGTEKKSMQALVEEGAFPKKSLVKIEIKPDKIRTIRKSLLNHGITETTVFPDLEGLARETKRYFGFNL